jgi:asparagine synthase (glutamine-hydrolysing)
MCGIAGILNLGNRDPVHERDLRQMLGMLRHRGPDEFGIFLDGPVGLGNARLSIIDLSTGQQPICNEDGTLWIVFNGEIFNYIELKPELEARGHRFRTTSDTEVLLHAYEEYGPKCLQRLNGQFAFAVWNARDESLFLARDRLGVRPLFYTNQGGNLLFGSEIKAILSTGQVRPELDLTTLNQVFTFWCPLPPRTIFKKILELPPGHYLVARGTEFKVSCYWKPVFPTCQESRPPRSARKTASEYEEEFRELLIDAVKVRLRADVPVGAYLSGGLDSSVIASIIRNFTTNRLDTFSIAFDDADFDESAWQLRMARFLGTGHQVVRATHADIGKVFPEVIWHTEVPIMRTAPVPMFLLSRLVREAGYKVVLTGEGADEFLAGYDIFKEAKVRRFWAAQPQSRLRPLLFKRLYPDIGVLAQNNPAMLAAFFREGLTAVDAPDYSHAIRWRNGRRNQRFFSEEVRRHLDDSKDTALEEILPSQFGHWSPLARAQFLEIRVFLSQYLLSSQGDRMGMAHSIEGRFPFLDFRLVDFCNLLPPTFKLRGLTEKYLLKQLGRQWLPEDIWQRPKRPYRAPIHRSFFNQKAPDYVAEMLSPRKINETGVFKAEAVSRLVQKIQQGSRASETDDMALAGILSTQLLHSHFVEHFERRPQLLETDNLKVCRRDSVFGGTWKGGKETVVP